MAYLGYCGIMAVKHGVCYLFCLFIIVVLCVYACTTVRFQPVGSSSSTVVTVDGKSSSVVGAKLLGLFQNTVMKYFRERKRN